MPGSFLHQFVDQECSGVTLSARFRGCIEQVNNSPIAFDKHGARFNLPVQHSILK